MQRWWTHSKLGHAYLPNNFCLFLPLHLCALSCLSSFSVPEQMCSSHLLTPPTPLSLLLPLHSHNGLLIPPSITYQPSLAKCIGHLLTLSLCVFGRYQCEKASLYPVRRFRDMLSSTRLSTFCQISYTLYSKLKCLIDFITCN